VTTPLRFDHVLSRPEHIWLAFWRTFFSQKTLVFGPDDEPIDNNFLYDPSVNDNNRTFDVKLVADYEDQNIALVPALILEDLNVSQQGILLDQRKTWSVTPNRANFYQDLLPYNYAIHCVSRDRGESRLLAGIVWQAINVFKDVLYQCGIHQLMPRSLSGTQPIRAAGKEDRVDTVLSVPFWMQEFWGYNQYSDLFPEQFCFFEAFEERTRFILGQIEIALTNKSKYFLSSMTLTSPSASRYMLGQEELVDPLSTSGYVLGQSTLVDASSKSRFVRGHMHVVAP
jgi:hypothetical protein